MNTAEKICEAAHRLSEPVAREVLDFIELLETRHGLRDLQAEHLKQAQMSAMHHVWDNSEDEAWNEL